jgi:hypothetical protein
MKELIRDRIVVDESYAEECNRNSHDSGKLYIENVEETAKYYAKANTKKETPLGLKNSKHIEEPNNTTDDEYHQVIDEITKEENEITQPTKASPKRGNAKRGGKK